MNEHRDAQRASHDSEEAFASAPRPSAAARGRVRRPARSARRPVTLSAKVLKWARTVSGAPML